MNHRDALFRMAISILYNKFLEEFEPPFKYNHQGMENFIADTGDDFIYSLSKTAHFIPESDTDVGDLLIAFEEFTRDADHEYMMMAVGHPSSEQLSSVSIARGDTMSVGWPRAGINHLQRTLGEDRRCRVVAAHNHPKGLLHDILRLLDLGLPGASSQDRDVHFDWVVRSIASNEVVPEFYLVEDRHFRRILAPSWSTMAYLLQSIFGDGRDATGS